MQNKVKVRISVKKSNDFIKELLRQEISLYDIQQNNQKIDIIINKEDYEKVEKMRMIEELNIINYYGWEKIKRFFKKYKVLGFSVLIGIIVNIVLSSIIMQIEIKTPNVILEDHIRQEIYKYGLKPFHLKKSTEQINQIKKELLKNDRIEWMEIEEQGTKYIITIEEKKKIKEAKCSNRNIVARKKAMIRSIESSSGEIIKRKNDYVEQGEIVISGEIHNKDEVVSQRCAEGKVLGETWYRVQVKIPQIVENKIKQNKYKWKIKMGSKSYPEKKWEIKKKYNIIMSEIYPIEISILYLQQIQIEKKRYKLNNIEKVAYIKAEKILENHFQTKPTIIKKKVLKKNLKNSKIIVEVFFAIEEDITSYQPISTKIKEG